MADSNRPPDTRAPGVRGSSTVAAPPLLVEVDDGARVIAEQLASGPVRDARGIEVAGVGRRSSGVEQRGEQARAKAPGRRRCGFGGSCRTADAVYLAQFAARATTRSIFPARRPSS